MANEIGDHLFETWLEQRWSAASEYADLIQTSSDIIKGFQACDIDPHDAIGILVGALIITHRISNIQVNINEMAEDIRQVIIDMDKKVVKLDPESVN
jgi:hypothetical protein